MGAKLAFASFVIQKTTKLICLLLRLQGYFNLKDVEEMSKITQASTAIAIEPDATVGGAICAPDLAEVISKFPLSLRLNFKFSKGRTFLFWLPFDNSLQSLNLKLILIHLSAFANVVVEAMS
jgi:hypothetical protein